jgi:hypothetical protein
LGSAAALRGGSSATTAVQVIHTLVDLSCTGASDEAFGDVANTSKIDLSFLAVSPTIASSISMQAAHAIGSILAPQGGCRLWKQGLTHIASKRIRQSRGSAKKLSNGAIVAICHVVCGANLRSVPATYLEWLSLSIVVGMHPRGIPSFKKDSAVVTKLLLVSLVKLLSIVPATLKECAYSVVTSSMRAFATADSFDPGDALACKLLALQILEAAAHAVGASSALRDSRPAVVSILAAAMNHPLCILRQAAVEVRNAWLLVE